MMTLHVPVSLKLLLLVVVGCSTQKLMSVTYINSEYEIHEGIVEGWVSSATFTDTTFDDGFAYLEVETNSDYKDIVQAYAAGLVEGAISYDMIYNSYRNSLEGYCEKTSQENCDRLQAFLVENRKWMEEAIFQLGGDDPILHNAELVLSQLDGITEGYNKTAENPIEKEAILWMNLMGDIDDLSQALNPEIRNMTIEEWIAAGHTPGPGHCSAIVKVLPDNSDIYFAQVTWGHYSSMLRILKKYIFPFRRTGNSGPADINPGHTVSFSSYPGMLFSGDDFHIMSSGLVSMETTIGNGNPELWQYVQPRSQLMEWMRTIICDSISDDGETWAKCYAMYNSGTYNNQWMILDYKLFTPGSPIQPNTLWIAEQIPGLVEYSDESALLMLQTYFPSYNTPFYETIFNLSGSAALVEKYGDWFTYENTSRALIFKRDHDTVKDMDSLFTLMRYNDYQNDPLSRCDCDPPYSGENGISARSDLNPVNGTFPFSALGHRLHGGTDVKMTNYEMAKNFLFDAINGPTYDQQPVFRWSEQEAAGETEPHFGHPDEWQFPRVIHEWEW